MKKSKKFLKVLSATAIAAIMATSMMSTTAFAAAGDAPATTAQTVTAPAETETGSDGSTLTATYKLYKVLTATPNAGGQVFDYSVVAGSVFATNSVTVDQITAAYGNNTNTKHLAKTLQGYVQADTTPNYTVNSGSSVNDVDPGYYLIIKECSDASMIAAPMLAEITNVKDTDNTFNISTNDKTSTLTFNKTIKEVVGGTVDTNGGKKTAEVGKSSTITYALDATFPMYDTDLVTSTDDTTTDITNFTITDKPSRGIDADVSTVKVYIDNLNVTTGFTTSEKAQDGSFTVTFDDSTVIKNRGKAVQVTFDAKLTDQASVNNVENDNTATLTYGNDYTTGTGSKTKTSDADVYTTQITVNKTDDSSIPLAGAAFKLYKYDGNVKGAEVDSVLTMKDKDGVITTDPSKATTFIFSQLAAGQYLLEETTVPTGYKKAADKVFTISTNPNDSTNKYDGTYNFAGDLTSDNVTVINTPGQELPGTGGVGTTMFTIGGIALVVVAGAMLTIYMKKRKTAE